MVTLAFFGNLAGPDLFILVVIPVLILFVGRPMVRWVIREMAQEMGRARNQEVEARLRVVEEKLERLGAK